jgi:arsenite methyltransferase
MDGQKDFARIDMWLPASSADTLGAQGDELDMSTGLQFDAEMARGLEAQYKRPAMVIRRAEALRLAAPKAGERALDVGCGPGFLCADLAAGVAEAGTVLGVDQSIAMIELAMGRCSGWPQASFEQADATALPTDDDSFDLAISTQVLEYVADVDRALCEIVRSIRPGGRLVLLATDWRSVAWHSSDDERMARLLSAWEEHLAHPSLPRTLASRLRDAGMKVTRIERHSILEGADDVMGYSNMMTGAISGFAPGRRGVTEEEAQAWAADLQELRERGDFHFSLGQYFFCATRPPAGDQSA